MDSVLLKQAVLENAFQKKWDQRHVVLNGQVMVHRLERLDVILAVIGRQCDPCQEDANVGGLETSHRLVEIGAAGGDGDSTKTVVAAEFEDHDTRLLGNDGGDTGQCVRSRFAADTEVEDVVRIAELVEIALKIVRITLARIGAIACGKTIAECGNDGSLVGCARDKA